MTNSLIAAARQDLLSRLKLKRCLDARIAPLHPRLFRQVIRIDRSDGPVLAECLQPWQQRDFAALDAAWLHLAGRGEPESAPAAILRRAYVERPRGHSKTSDTAVQVCWILLAARAAVSGLAAAADREQAQLIHDAIRRLARLNGHLCGDLTFTQHQVRNRRTLSRIDIISSDVASSWGQLPDFVICDELCHWTKQDLWNSLVSSAAKKPGLRADGADERRHRPRLAVGRAGTCADPPGLALLDTRRAARSLDHRRMARRAAGTAAAQRV